MWDGVRNFEARNNLRAMQTGDLLLFYHSNEGKEIVGIAEVVREHYPDPDCPNEPWVLIDVKATSTLSRPVTLAEIKSEPKLAAMSLVTCPRLSVQPVTPQEWKLVEEISKRGAVGLSKISKVKTPVVKDARAKKAGQGSGFASRPHVSLALRKG